MSSDSGAGAGAGLPQLGDLVREQTPLSPAFYLMKLRRNVCRGDIASRSAADAQVRLQLSASLFTARQSGLAVG